MNKIFKIIGFIFKENYRISKDEKKGGRIAAYAVIAVMYLFLEFAVVGLVIAIAPKFKETELIPELLTGIMVVGLAAVTFLGILPMMNMLYFSKDSEFFLGLPVSSSVVYFAKLSIVYLAQLALVAALILPALIAVGITVGLNWPFFAIILFSVAFLPAFSLLALSVICLPLMYVVKFFRNRAAVASITTLILFAAFFIAYMLLIPSENSEGDVDYFALLIEPFVKMSEIFVPITALSRFATFTKMQSYGEGVSMLFNFLIFMVPVLILFIIALLISRRAYTSAVAVQLEHGSRNKTGEIHKGKTGILKALVIKEWKEILRTPVFLLQCCMGLVIAPVILIAMGESIAMSVNDGFFTAFFVTVFLQFLVVSINIGASTAFSRSGEAFYLSKLLPVPYDTQLKAKLIFYNSIYDVDLLICYIIELFTVGLKGWWLYLLLFAYIIIYNYGFTTLCITLDLSSPRLNWKSYREIVKNSRNAMMPMFIGMLVSVFVGGAAIGLYYLLLNFMSAVLAAVLISVLMLGGAIAFAFIMRSILRSNSKKYFDRIEA